MNGNALNDQLPTDMPTANRPYNDGKSMDDNASRLDGIAKVTGRATYSRDRYMDNQLFVAFVRCPWGAGRLVQFDEAAVRRMPGVLEVTMTGEEGKYHGHNVGYIVAESKHELRRAMAAARAQWQQSQPKISLEQAASPAPATDSDTRDLLDRADGQLEATYATQTQTHSCLETHGSVVDHRGDSAVVYASTQGTMATADGIQESIGLPREKYEVICEYIGGGFGSKLNGAGKEGAVAAEVSRKYKRPVSLFVDRDEDHLDTGNRPAGRAQVKIGFTNDGTILGGQIHTWGLVGVGSGGGGVSFPSGHYNLGEIQSSHENVQINAGAPRPFRAPGRPQGVFMEELMMEEIAARTGIDPVELRLRHETSDARKEMLRYGRERIGWDRRQPNGSQRAAVRRGFGCAAASWGRFPANTEAEVAIHRDGTVEPRTGTQDIGTGMRTAAGIIACETLGVPLSHARVRIGRSTLPPGPASGGSMTTHNTAPPLMQAAEEAKGKLLATVAERQGLDASEFDIVDGYVVRNGQSVMSFEEACRNLPDRGVVGRGESSNRGDHPTWQKYGGEGHPDGVQFAEIEVDTETGVIRVRRIVALQSCGRVVCRKTAESQIIGGVIQGISFALFEDKILDNRHGAMVNSDLEMYKILGSADMPHIEPILWDKGQTGVRSLGEPPTIPTSGAIACALYNAIGRPVRHLPLTPDKVLAALEGGEA